MDVNKVFPLDRPVLRQPLHLVKDEYPGAMVVDLPFAWTADDLRDRQLEKISELRRSRAMAESGERFIDAGEMGCGELVMLLKMTMNELSPGDCIRVIALDPGAPVDLPAWCRLTGHSLQSSEHPEYLIRKKENC